MTERSPNTPPDGAVAEERQAIYPVARHPFADTDLEPGRKGYQERTIRLAARELWPPDGKPSADLSKAERNRALWSWYKQRGIADVRDQASERHIRRVFNGR